MVRVLGKNKVLGPVGPPDQKRLAVKTIAVKGLVLRATHMTHTWRVRET